MVALIPFIQIGLAVLLMVLILVQQSDASLGAAFGSDDGGITRTRRGAERTLFLATIVVAVLFIVSAIAALLLR
jgi:protein translocase SecG subunit